MKAWILKEYNQPMEMAEVETPGINDDEILLRVKACGICRTDLKIYRGEIPPPIVTLPHIPGHEVAGEVVAVGSRVTGIQVKDIGIVYIYIACHRCSYCLNGRETSVRILNGLDLNFPEDTLNMSGYRRMPFAHLKRGFPMRRWPF
jgi:D-arabinose 1-dehydrogenase-like Zn-dependent alcohol dehydrogenase